MTPGPTQPDVRMCGFRHRSTVEESLDWLDAEAGQLETEPVELAAAHGRVLAAEFTARLDVPAFDRSAMDGYALCGRETDGAGEYNPLALRVLGESLPGQPFDGHVSPGTAVRIMTGAPLPRGADAVLPAEYATESNGVVEVSSAVPPGRHVGQRGEDVRVGDLLLPAGRRLRPQDVGLLASVGVVQIGVVRRPCVRIVITGNELVPAGAPRGLHQIFESNSIMLEGLVDRDGGAIESLRRCVDERDEIHAAITAEGADVVLVSGGSSVGAEDHAPTIVAESGELAIHGIAMRPSSPTGLGCVGESLVVLLPGNPVSCLCAYDFFAGRAIRRMGGRSVEWPYVARMATVSAKIVSAIGRVDYCRVRLTGDSVEPIALSGASILSSTTRADGFVIVPADSEGYGVGTKVTVRLYDSFG